MTTTTDHPPTTTVSRPIISHPAWCARVAEDAPRDERGRLLEMAEKENEHQGMPYHLEVGGAFDTIRLRIVQMYGFDVDGETVDYAGEPEIALELENRELIGGATVHLRSADVDQLMHLLNRVKRDLEVAACHG